jgi:hypothetical protein
MEEISVTTQGIKGGKTKTQKVGYVLTELRHDQDRIIVDDFEGQGNSYKKRELLEITIIQNGKILFKGNKYELFELLKNK